MVKVEWQSKNSPYRVPFHGLDFGDNDPKSQEYVKYLIEENKACLRVWVNGVQVWQYHF